MQKAPEVRSQAPEGQSPVAGWAHVALMLALVAFIVFIFRLATD